MPDPPATAAPTSGAMTPVDAAARRRAECDLSNCLSVEAGAGTGKTTLMVRRILQIVRSGAAEIDEVLAISFTEKAAAELRAQVRGKLDREARVATGDERDRLRRALDGFDRAQISTIHGLAGALLRERPVEAGLDPAFEVLDELSESLSFEEFWTDWLDRELAAAPLAARRALDLGLDLRRLREAAKLLHDQRDLLPETWPEPEEFTSGPLLEELRSQAQSLEALAPSCQKPEEDRGFAVLGRITSWIETALRSSPESFERMLAARGTFDKRAGSQANWRPKEDCITAKAIFGEVNDLLLDARTALGQSVTAALAGWLSGFIRSYEWERRRAARAEFQDLLVWARNMLRDHLAARAYFQRRFRHVLVDEFQDTDPLQVEIVFFLAEDGAGACHWQDVRLIPGKLFIVGDPKQAIYRFRRADLAIYEAARAAVRSCGGEEIAIVQNFRSVAPILDWVNRVFTRLIGDGTPPYQAQYLPLSASHPAHPNLDRPPVVALYPIDGAAADASSGASSTRSTGRCWRAMRPQATARARPAIVTSRCSLPRPTRSSCSRTPCETKACRIASRAAVCSTLARRSAT